MKIKLDENILVGLAFLLSQMRHDLDTAMQEGLAGHEDGCGSHATAP